MSRVVIRVGIGHPGRFGLARHGAGLTFHRNCEGHTSPSANFTADIVHIAVGIVHWAISTFPCRLALQPPLPLSPLSVPGHNPHPALPPLPGDNHVENPPRAVRRPALPRRRLCRAGPLSGVCVPRRRVSLGAHRRLWRASARQFGWVGDLGRRLGHAAKHRAKK